MEPSYVGCIGAHCCQRTGAVSFFGSLQSQGFYPYCFFSHCRKLPELLETGDVDFRIAAGETIALMNEVVRETRVESSKLPNMDALCTRLRELSTESTKHRAKKDKKQQRSSFRNILHSIEVQLETCTILPYADGRHPLEMNVY